MISRLLLLLLFPAGLTAQAVRIDYFTDNNGLSTRDINDLYIGQDGFLWVATMDGLNRFDGHSFLSFGQGPSSETRLSRGAIESISLDNERKLILNFQDFYGFFDRFDPADFSVNQVRMVPSTGVNGYPRAIETDRFGRTFVVTVSNDKTSLYEHTVEGFELINSLDVGERSTLAPRIELLPLHNGQFLLYDEERGFRHLSASGRVIGSFFPRTSNFRQFYTMAQAVDGQVYLSFNEGYPLYRWKPEARRQPRPVPNLDDGLRYTKIFRDEAGQLLLAATEDILGQGYPDEYYLVDTLGEFGLFDRPLPTNRLVSAVAAMNFNETIYLGLREGLGVMERYVNPVQSYLTNDGSDDYHHTVRGIAEDRHGTVYVVEYNGRLHTIGPDATTTTELLLQSPDSTLVSLRKASQLIYDPVVDAIWGLAAKLGKREGLLFRYDVSTGFTTTYPSDYQLTSLALGPYNELYLGALDRKRVGALLRFNRTNGRFLPVSEANGRPVQGLRINYLLGATNDQLLIGTRNRGVVVYDPTRKTQSSLSKLDNVTVNVIQETDDGHWWVGTDAGLYDYDPRDSSLQHFGRRDGLSSNRVVGILPDSVGGLWLSTNNGIVHVPADRDAGTFRRYYLEDGLTNDEFARFSFHRDRSGRYFFGGDDGLTAFREGDLSSESAGSDVMLTEIVVYGRGQTRVLNQNLKELEELEIAASEKSLAVSFALPVGQRPSASQFRVKLEGFDEDWQEIRNERTVRYNNLPAGRYQLLVQGAGANGNYGTGRLSLNIRVRQYFIERLWAQALLALLIASLFIAILQSRLRERLRNEQLRTQLSSDIHDEVSGLLAGITLQAELLKNRTEDEKLRNRLNTVGEAGRNAMSKMSDVIWSIDSRRDTIGNLLQRMQEHADEVLLPLDIRYDFKAYGFNREDELPGNIRQDVYFIYKEAINNIARHSNATRVDIELEQFAQTFEMFIRDNGKSEPKEQERITANRFTPKSGQGKDNMKMRAIRLKGELTIDDRAGYTLILRMKRLA